MSINLITSVVPIQGGDKVTRKISLASYEDFVSLEEALGQLSFSKDSSISLEIGGEDRWLVMAMREDGPVGVPGSTGHKYSGEDADEAAMLFRLVAKVRRRLSTPV